MVPEASPTGIPVMKPGTISFSKLLTKMIFHHKLWHTNQRYDVK